MIIFYNTYSNHYAISSMNYIYCSYNKDWCCSKYDLNGVLLTIFCLKLKTLCLYKDKLYFLGDFFTGKTSDEAFKYFKFKLDSGYLL